MALLTLSEMRTHLETDLTDAALQRLLDAAERQILDVVGPSAAVTETFDSYSQGIGNPSVLYLSRGVAASTNISSIVEREYPGGTGTTLAANDWALRGIRELVRLSDGTNGRTSWAPVVEVAHTPDFSTAIQKEVQSKLVKISANFSGLAGERYGDFDFRSADVAAMTETALASLRGGRDRMVLR